MENRMMDSKEAGFTLIELIMVIVILGILAITALPKLNDLRGNASAAATSGVAGALNTAFSTNYSAFFADSNKGVAVNASTQLCNDVAVTSAGGILQGGLPSGYAMVSAGASSGVDCRVAGTTLACLVSGPNSSSASVTLVCTG